MGSQEKTQKEINNKAIVLTGSSGGVGYAITQKFFDNGYHVFGLDIKEPKENLEGLIKTRVSECEASPYK